MTHLGSVLTRIKQKFYLDGNRKPIKVGAPVVDQIRFPESVNKAATEVPGLTGEQVYWLKKEGYVTVQEQNELIRYELVSADDYTREYQAAVAKRDAE